MHGNKKAAIFLDRDGTIIEDRGHLRDTSDIIFFPETFEALQKLQEHFLLFIVTNQTGVARGLINLDDVKLVNDGVVAALAEAGIKITKVYVCPHDRSENCVCIKPNPYFLRKAAKDYHLDLRRSFTVGDHPHDIQFAEPVGARGIYLLTGHGDKHLAELAQDTEVVSGIMEAAEKMVSYHIGVQVSL